MQNFDALPFHSVTIENTRLSAAGSLRAVADGLADAASAGHPAQLGRMEVRNDRGLYDVVIVYGETAHRVCLTLDLDPGMIRLVVAQACADLHARAVMEAIRAAH